MRRGWVHILYFLSSLSQVPNVALAQSTDYRGVCPRPDYAAVDVSACAANDNYICIRASAWFDAERLNMTSQQNVQLRWSGSTTHGNGLVNVSESDLLAVFFDDGVFAGADTLEVRSAAGNVARTAFQGTERLSVPSGAGHAVTMLREVTYGKCTRATPPPRSIEMTSALPPASPVILPTAKAFTDCALVTTHQCQRMPQGVLQLHLVHVDRTPPVDRPNLPKVAITTVQAIAPFYRARLR